MSTENGSSYLMYVEIICSNLGILYANTNRYEEAEGKYEEALAQIKEMSLGVEKGVFIYLEIA